MEDPQIFVAASGIMLEQPDMSGREIALGVAVVFHDEIHGVTLFKVDPPKRQLAHVARDEPIDLGAVQAHGNGDAVGARLGDAVARDDVDRAALLGDIAVDRIAIVARIAAEISAQHLDLIHAERPRPTGAEKGIPDLVRPLLPAHDFKRFHDRAAPVDLLQKLGPAAPTRLLQVELEEAVGDRAMALNGDVLPLDEDHLAIEEFWLLDHLPIDVADRDAVAGQGQSLGRTPNGADNFAKVIDPQRPVGLDPLDRSAVTDERLEMLIGGRDAVGDTHFVVESHFGMGRAILVIKSVPRG